MKTFTLTIFRIHVSMMHKKNKILHSTNRSTNFQIYEKSTNNFKCDQKKKKEKKVLFLSAVFYKYALNSVTFSFF